MIKKLINLLYKSIFWQIINSTSPISRLYYKLEAIKSGNNQSTNARNRTRTSN